MLTRDDEVTLTPDEQEQFDLDHADSEVCAIRETLPNMSATADVFEKAINIYKQRLRANSGDAALCKYGCKCSKHYQPAATSGDAQAVIGQYRPGIDGPYIPPMVYDPKLGKMVTTRPPAQAVASPENCTTDERETRTVGPHGGLNEKMPSPTGSDLADPLFNAIWNTCKTWDVNAPEYYVGYCGLNGSHVMLIVNAIRAANLHPPAPAESATSGEGRLETLPADVVAMCKNRGWSMHWTHRGAYLHLESSELIEAIRGKHGDPAKEAGDVLMVLMSITEYAGIPWPTVLQNARSKCDEMMVKPHYAGEEWSAPPAIAPQHAELVGRFGVLAGLVREVMHSHADKESCDYNTCDDGLCAWCETAAAALSGGRSA